MGKRAPSPVFSPPPFVGTFSGALDVDDGPSDEDEVDWGWFQSSVELVVGAEVLPLSVDEVVAEPDPSVVDSCQSSVEVVWGLDVVVLSHESVGVLCQASVGVCHESVEVDSQSLVVVVDWCFVLVLVFVFVGLPSQAL